MNPWGFYLVNILIHAANSVVLFYLIMIFLGRFGNGSVRLIQIMAFYAACLFAVPPVHVEAVTGIVGRAELMVLFFGLIFWSNILNKYPESVKALSNRGYAMNAGDYAMKRR